MSSGTNQERIEQNNLKLAQLKTKADNLPEYQNVEPIYGALDYSSKTYSIQAIPANKYPSAFVIGKILIYAGNQKAMYIYYDGEYIGQYTSTVDNNQHYVAIVYHDNTEFVFVVNRDYPSTGSTSNYEGAIVNIVNKTITPIASISTLFAGYAMTTDGETCLISSNNRICRYNKDTNTFKYYNVDLGNNYYYITHPSTATYQFAIYRTDSSHGGGKVKRFRYDKNTDTYSVSTVNINNVDGVSFLGNKIFLNGNVYILNGNLTVGSLIKSNVYTPASTSSGYSKVFYWINESYVIFYGDNYLYKWDDETNTLTRYISMKYSCLGGYNISGTTVTQYTFNHSSEKIGYKVDDISLYLSSQPTNATSSDVLTGKSVYTSGADRMTGTMPNNGALNYTPTTSQQTIPAGYTSGGTVGAVSMSEEDIQEAEEQIANLFGEGE